MTQPRSSTPLLDRLHRRYPASGSSLSGPCRRWSSQRAGQDRAWAAYRSPDSGRFLRPALADSWTWQQGWSGDS